jgi:hypothetical protein
MKPMAHNLGDPLPRHLLGARHAAAGLRTARGIIALGHPGACCSNTSSGPELSAAYGGINHSAWKFG